MAIPEDRDPIDLFSEWYAGAEDCGLKEPTAVMLATADTEGRPSARMVLLKDVDQRGFTFYTNLDSRKGTELRANPIAAMIQHPIVQTKFHAFPEFNVGRNEAEPRPVIGPGNGADVKLSGIESDPLFQLEASF